MSAPETTTIYFVQWRWRKEFRSPEKMPERELWRMWTNSISGDEYATGQLEQELKARHRGVEFRRVKSTLAVEEY